MTDKRKRTGITVGILFGLTHALWVGAVVSGAGQTIIDALEAGHFLSSTYTTTTVEPMTAGAGILGAGITGYMIGWIGIYIYDMTGRYLD
ncbi:MAG: hypothetical protein MUP66_00190 [Candidatus Nanohaloarchaeota archaeon QJJ-5]|nr:hypothetical protein [Candidatus Nanohaloarchaeota archaeon QJJ-5]